MARMHRKLLTQYLRGNLENRKSSRMGSGFLWARGHVRIPKCKCGEIRVTVKISIAIMFISSMLSCYLGLMC